MSVLDEEFRCIDCGKHFIHNMNDARYGYTRICCPDCQGPGEPLQMLNKQRKREGKPRIPYQLSKMYDKS